MFGSSRPSKPFRIRTALSLAATSTREQTQLDDQFKELNRPLAPLFIPVTAISTGLAWPGDEYGMGIGYSKKRWGVRVSGSKKRAAITNDQTTTGSIMADYRWTSRVSTGVRLSQIQGTTEGITSVSSDSIQTGGLDLSLAF